MTSEKMRHIVLSAIKRSPDRTPDILAERIVRAIEIVVQAEELMAEDQPAQVEDTEKPIEWPITLQDKTPLSPSIVTPTDARQETPVPGVPASGLIVLPDSPEAREVLRPRPPDRVLPMRPAGVVAKTSGSDGKPKWELYDLNQAIHQNSPPMLQITVQHPERGPVSLALERNVMTGPGFDAVKLIYKHPACNDDMAVFETFWCVEEKIDMQGAMERIKKSAQAMYRPRPRNLVPVAPIRTGPMTFNESDPHDAADKLFDAKSGSWY